LQALQRERDELHDRIMQVDRIMKRLKGIDTIDSSNGITEQLQVVPILKDKPQPISPTKSNNIKIVILSVFDILKTASKLKDIQLEYEKISGNKYDIRETVRTLYRANRLRMIKEKGVNKTCYWVKSEWIDNGQLLDEFKPEGFDLLYLPGDLIYQ
jgi:hypothetical protein